MKSGKLHLIAKVILPSAALVCVSVLLLALPLPLNPQTPQTRPTVLSGQSATVLPDGRWLVAGGESGGGSLGSAAIWEPISGRTLPVGSGLQQGRAWHSATLLADGNVLLVGGVGPNGTVLNSAEIFNPTTQTFQTVTLRGVTARARHTATVLTEGQVLLAGGIGANGNALVTAELIDTFDGTVIQATNTSSARRDHTATLMPDGGVLLWGGTGNQNSANTTGEVYSPVTKRFTPVASYPNNFFPSPTDGPIVEASLPSDRATNVPEESMISFRVSKPLRMNSVNENTVVLTGPKGVEKIKVVLAENGSLIFVTPGTELLPGSTYRVTINGAMDQYGLLLPVTGISFTTVGTSTQNQGGGSLTVVPSTSAAKPAEASSSKPDLDSNEGNNDNDLTWRGSKKDGNPHSRWQDLPALQAKPNVTALSGQVLDLRGNPLANVKLEIEGSYGVEGKSTKTDNTGRFLIEDIPAGWREMIIDGRGAHEPRSRARESNWGYGLFEYGLEIKEGQTTVLPFTIWLPKIDTAHAQKIASPTPDEVIVTNPKIPGLELRIPRGATIYDHEGNTVDEVSLTQIPLDRTPFPLPRNVEVPIFFTAQPGGAYISGYRGGRIVYPNLVKELPGARFSFWNYTTGPAGWYVYGEGTVSQDGKQVFPDPGVTIYEFNGAMINGPGGPPPPKGPPAPCKPPAKCPKEGDPVDLSTGLFVLDKTDLHLPDVMPLSLTRTYRQSDLNTRPFGIGTMHAYSIFLYSTNQYQEADFIMPDGGRVHYVRTSPGTSFTDAVFEHRGPDASCSTCVGTPSSFNASKIAWNGNGWNLTLRDGMIYVFGVNQPLQAIRDRNGNQITITRAGGGQSGNITQITSPNGRWIQFTYDTSNRITQAKDNIGRIVGYEYDTSGRLKKVTDPNLGTTEYTYDTSHRMKTIKDARGIVFLTNDYDANGRVMKQTLADNGIYQFAYQLDGSGNVTRTDVTNPRNVVRRVDFGSAGYGTTETLALGTAEAQVSTNTIQTGSNLVTSSTDALGRQTTYQYDSKGNITSITRLAGTADAVTTMYTYDPVHSQVTSITDPLMHTWSFGRDSKGNLTSITNPLNQTTILTNYPDGQPASIKDALNNLTQYTYDFGDLVSVVDPLGNTSTRFTDAAGRVLTKNNPLGDQSIYDYDVLNRLTKVTDALNGQTQFGYDPNGNLLSVTDARNNQTVYTYELMDRLQTRRDPLLRTENYQYDFAGNMSQFTDRRNQTSAYIYDSLNRRTKVTYQDGSTTDYTYDKGNRLTNVVDSNAGPIIRTYDGLNRLTSEQTPQGTVSYTYDAANRRATMTVPGQAQTVYTYDNANRLTQVTQGSSTITYTYDAAGRRTSLTLPNGVLVEYGYDNASRLTSITYKQNGTTVLGNLTYEYDQNGNRIKTGGSFARTGVPQAVASTNYNVNNQQTVFGGKTLTYDNNGNVQTITEGGNTTTYTWNARNQLTQISGPGVNATFVYDGLGRREKKTINGNATEFLYDGLNPVQESSGAPVIANLLTGLGIDDFLTRTDSGTSATSFFLTDALGSAVALTNSSGSLQTEFTYEPFGKTSITGLTNSSSYQYTGRENDGTGLLYYRNRYYHPDLARFISEDPIEFNGGEYNLYPYVGDNPLLYIDPLGLDKCKKLNCDPKPPCSTMAMGCPPTPTPPEPICRTMGECFGPGAPPLPTSGTSGQPTEFGPSRKEFDALRDVQADIVDSLCDIVGAILCGDYKDSSACGVFVGYCKSRAGLGGAISGGRRQK